MIMLTIVRFFLERNEIKIIKKWCFLVYKFVVKIINQEFKGYLLSNVRIIGAYATKSWSQWIKVLYFE